ncbi:MAG: hypothetical protein AAGD07_16865 [Planctomycetota bacterium]
MRRLIRGHQPLKRRCPLTFVIASTPRSGTQYTSRLLQSLGVHCSHEVFFGPHAHRHEMYVCNPLRREFYQGIAPLGDSSWLAVPFLDELPDNVAVIHQVREPVTSINSILHTRHFDWDEPLDDPVSADFHRFLQRVTRDWAWPDDKEQKAILFWNRWHQQIFEQSTRRPYFQLRLEDLSEETVSELLAFIGIRTINQREIQRLIEASCKTTNRNRGEPVPRVSWDDLPAETIELAHRMGYHEPATQTIQGA